MAIRVWYPLYDKHLAWVGMCLEVEGGTGVIGVASHADEARLLEQFVFPKKLLLNAAVLQRLQIEQAQLIPNEHYLIHLDPLFQQQANHLETASAWSLSGANLVEDGVSISQTTHYCSLDAASAKIGLDERVLLEQSKQGRQLIARAIGSLPLFNWCLSSGFSYFSFSALNVVQYSDVPPPFSSLPIMQLLSLIEQDAEVGEMDEVFKRDPKLAFELLKMVNSAAFSTHKEITSFTQAIMMLGQSQLKRWLQLLMYAQPAQNSQMPNILMQRAAERGRLMELLAKQSVGKIVAEQAFMVGVFSLLDVLMSTPLKVLLAEVTLPVNVGKALLEAEGELGALLSLVSAIENGRFASIQRLQAKLALSDEQLSIAQLEAITWALTITRS